MAASRLFVRRKLCWGRFLVFSFTALWLLGFVGCTEITKSGFTVGGTVFGLSGTLVLRNNGGDDLNLTFDGSFTFASTLTDGAGYDVTVFSQPAGQNCTVSGGQGTVPGDDVTGVIVSCAAGSGGTTVTGTSGSAVALDGNWGVCTAISPDSVDVVDNFSGSTLSETIESYDGNEFCGVFSYLTENLTGNFTLGTEVTATLEGSARTATRMDFSWSSYTATLHDSAFVTTFNSNQICGITNWAVGVPQDLFTTTCFPAGSFKTILHVDDLAVPDLLYFGILEINGGPVDFDGYPNTLEPNFSERR